MAVTVFGKLGIVWEVFLLPGFCPMFYKFGFFHECFIGNVLTYFFPVGAALSVVIAMGYCC